MNRDFSNSTAHQQQALAQQQSIQDASTHASDAPTEAEANALIAQRGRISSQPVKGIPQKVLSNVQHTTGISPEEINRLMNQ